MHGLNWATGKEIAEGCHFLLLCYPSSIPSSLQLSMFFAIYTKSLSQGSPPMWFTIIIMSLRHLTLLTKVILRFHLSALFLKHLNTLFVHSFCYTLFEYSFYTLFLLVCQGSWENTIANQSCIGHLWLFCLCFVLFLPELRCLLKYTTYTEKSKYMNS